MGRSGMSPSIFRGRRKTTAAVATTAAATTAATAAAAATAEAAEGQHVKRSHHHLYEPSRRFRVHYLDVVRFGAQNNHVSSWTRLPLYAVDRNNSICILR